MNIIIEEVVSEFPVLITEEVFQITISDAVSYFDIVEVGDTDFVGKDGYVPVVDEATGKLVLQAQQSGPGGGVPEAPNNSNAYVRSALSWVIGYTKTAIDNLLNGKFNNPTGNNTQYLDGAGTPTTFPAIPSISGLATETYVNNELAYKVDKVTGKGLSTEDYTTTEKSKLSGIASSATANDTDANLKNRANHTGTQLASTISDFASQVGTLITSALASFKTDNFLDFTSSGQTQLDGKSDKLDLCIKSITSDITTTANTQLNTNLSFPIGANEVWTVEFNLMGGCANSGGIRVTINAPSGSSGGGAIIGTSSTTFVQQVLNVNNLSTAFGWNNSNTPQRIYLTIRSGVTAGNVQFSFASASSGQTSVIRANSYMIATKSILV